MGNKKFNCNIANITHTLTNFNKTPIVHNYIHIFFGTTKFGDKLTANTDTQQVCIVLVTKQPEHVTNYNIKVMVVVLDSRHLRSLSICSLV